jgi:hypothetical protein
MSLQTYISIETVVEKHSAKHQSLQACAVRTLFFSNSMVWIHNQAQVSSDLSSSNQLRLRRFIRTIPNRHAWTRCADSAHSNPRLETNWPHALLWVISRSCADKGIANYIKENDFMDSACLDTTLQLSKEYWKPYDSILTHEMKLLAILPEFSGWLWSALGQAKFIYHGNQRGKTNDPP